MARNPQLIKDRNRQIKELYHKYATEYVLGPKGEKFEKYTHPAMLAMVAKKFYLEPSTVGNILIAPDEDAEAAPNQLDLFKEDLNNE